MVLLKVIQDDAIPIEVSRLPDAIHIDSFNSTPSTIWDDVTSSEHIKGALLFRNKRHLYNKRTSKEELAPVT